MNDHAASIAVLLGILLVTVGAASFDWRYGFLVSGILLLLSIRSLWRWIK